MTVPYMVVPLGLIKREADSEKPLFVDFETKGLYGDITLAQFKQEDWEVAYLVETPNRERLQNLLKGQWVVCYNIAYDMGTLGIAPEHMDDLYFASKTAFPLQEHHTLADTAPQFYVGIDKKEMQKSFKQLGMTDEQLHYGALDVFALEWIWNNDSIQDVLADNLAYRVDIKAQRHALEYEHNGMPVIHKNWVKAKDETEAKRATYQARLNALVGWDLNVKSYQQKQKAFPELPKGPDGKIPTGEPAFKRLYLESRESERKEAYKLVMDTTKMRTQLQDLEKYRYSYYEKEKPLRIRTFFNVAGAITGRFTSKGGDREGYTNIQNIGRHFKHIFGYEDRVDRSIVSADYGTAELIAGTAIFKVPTMRNLIMDGIDLHKAMASEVTGKHVDLITKGERQHAKAINFGYLFGMGIERFQSYAYDVFGVQLTEEQAGDYKSMYYEAHPAIKRYHKNMGRQVKKEGFIVETALGRRVHPSRYMDALNIPVQGTIAETTKMAINFLYEDYPSLMKEVMIINMVHDSIVIDSPDGYIEDVSVALDNSMKTAWREISKSPLFHYHDLPIGVDIDVGKVWK